MIEEKTGHIPLQMFPTLEQFVAFKTPFPTWWSVDKIVVENLVDEKTKRVETKRMERIKNELKIHPVNVYESNNSYPTPTIFAARYEFAKYGEQLTCKEAYEEATRLNINWAEVYGFIDFVVGVPYASIDTIKIFGERTTKPEDLDVKPDDGRFVPPMPTVLFEDKEQHKIVFNILWLEQNSNPFAENLSGERDLEGGQFWLRFLLTRTIKYESETKREEVDTKFPIPGELLGLAVRMMPYLPYMEQKSSPFLSTGNYIETLFYTCALVEDVIEVDPENVDKVPYERYKIFYRGQSYIITPSDFRVYITDEEIEQIRNQELFVFVNILKDYNDFNKPTMLWKEEKPPTERWRIYPVDYYLEEVE